MAQKKILNIVYAPGKGKPSKVFENEKGEIWTSNSYDPNKKNIGMGWYSIRNPKPGDCILVVEPRCVLEKDYSVNFTKKFQYIFTWASKAFQHPQVKDKVVEISHPTYHGTPGPGISERWPEWKNRHNRIVFVANNKSSTHHSELYSFRLLLADILHARSTLDVEWYAQIPIRRPYYKGQVDNKQKLLRQTRFSVCTENCYDPVFSHNYFTEKMPDVWKSGAVPIYFGCHNIDSFNLPKNSYIDLRKYCRKDGNRWLIEKPALLRRIEEFSAEQHAEYLKDLKEEVFATDKFYKLTAYEQTYKKMLDTFVP